MAKTKRAYMLLTAMTPHELVSLVNKGLQEGWDIWGATTTPVVSGGEGAYVVYTQAMVIYEALEAREQKDVT